MDFFVDGIFNVLKYLLTNIVYFLKDFLWGFSRLSIALFIAYTVVGFFIYLFYTRKKRPREKTFLNSYFPKKCIPIPRP